MKPFSASIYPKALCRHRRCRARKAALAYAVYGYYGGYYGNYNNNGCYQDAYGYWVCPNQYAY